MIKKFFINYVFIVYLEFLYALLIYTEYLRSSIFNILLYAVIVSILITFITSIFSKKVNKILSIIIYSTIAVIFSVHFVFISIFATPFSLTLFTIVDQAIGFADDAFAGILKSIYAIILFFMPLVLTIVFNKKINVEFKFIDRFKEFLTSKIKFLSKIKIYKVVKKILVFLFTFSLAVFIFILNIKSQDESYGAYELVNKVNNQSLSIQKLGILNATFLDASKIIFGFEESIEATVEEEETESDDIFVYDYNNLDYDFSKYTSSDSNITTINKYLTTVSGTKKNKYTGIFEDYNIIYITAESFSEIAVSEELTPTLYKLVNTGFKFNNFYTSYSLSTIGGEFQSLTGLYASREILKTFRSGTVSFPYGLGTIFKNSGYNTYAYHDHSYTFQDRYVYMKSMGFDNFQACRNGIEKKMDCSHWPNSDVDMINGTVGDYLDSDKPFLAYYMTVSGHMNYTQGGNYIVRKNWDKVKDLDYSDNVKGYLATQIELDKALETLINKLDAAGKLDNTVIVLLADHYPYDLTLSEINELSTYERDSVIEVNHNNLIIWNNKLKTIEVDKPAMSIDVIPTVYNLFGLEYDSRLFVGNDILSTSTGLAIFSDMSWVTDKGKYFAKNGKYTGELTTDYINNMNNVVKNRVNISKLIISKNYYKYLLSQ